MESFAALRCGRRKVARRRQTCDCAVARRVKAGESAVPVSQRRLAHVWSVDGEHIDLPVVCIAPLLLGVATNTWCWTSLPLTTTCPLRLVIEAPAAEVDVHMARSQSSSRFSSVGTYRFPLHQIPTVPRKPDRTLGGS
jgi:hypothetical protein